MNTRLLGKLYVVIQSCKKQQICIPLDLQVLGRCRYFLLTNHLFQIDSKHFFLQIQSLSEMRLLSKKCIHLTLFLHSAVTTASMFVVFLIMWPGTIMWTEVIFDTRSLGAQQKQDSFLFEEKLGGINWKKGKLLVA